MENNTEKNNQKNISVLGLLSTIFGGLSLVPFLGIFSVPGLILGIIGLIKKGGTLAIVGTALSAVGVATSPTLWAIAICSVDPQSCEQTVENKLESAESRLKKAKEEVRDAQEEIEAVEEKLNQKKNELISE